MLIQDKVSWDKDIEKKLALLNTLGVDCVSVELPDGPHKDAAIDLSTQESATRRSAELKGATAALKESAAALVAQFGSVYGPSFAASFTPLWARQGDLILAYASAGKDQKRKAKAAAELTQHSKDMAAFLVGANSSLNRAELEQLFANLVSGLEAVVDAQLAGDFDKAGVAIRTTAAATDPIGSSLTQGTVLKFPSKFQPVRTPSPTPGSASPSPSASTR